MTKQRLSVAVIAVVLGALTASGTAVAEDRQSRDQFRDHHAFCERLADTPQALRERIGQIESLQQRIEEKIASGELTLRQEARAKQALRKLEELQAQLEEKLERVFEVYAEKCTR